MLLMFVDEFITGIWLKTIFVAHSVFTEFALLGVGAVEIADFGSVIFMLIFKLLKIYVVLFACRGGDIVIPFDMFAILKFEDPVDANPKLAR